MAGLASSRSDISAKRETTIQDYDLSDFYDCLWVTSCLLGMTNAQLGDRGDHGKQSWNHLEAHH